MRGTRLQKQLFPLFWFGPPVCVVVWMLSSDRWAPEWWMLGLVALDLAGFVFVRARVQQTLDEVVDAGDHLVVRNDDEEARIPFADIAHVEGGFWGVTLRLTRPGRLGDALTFVPRGGMRPYTFGPNAILVDLMVRVAAMRQRAG